MLTLLNHRLQPGPVPGGVQASPLGAKPVAQARWLGDGPRLVLGARYRLV